MLNLARFETDLWSAADNLRANSKLTSSDYFMPMLGIIFLRHAGHPALRFRVPAERAGTNEDSLVATKGLHPGKKRVIEGS